MISKKVDEIGKADVEALVNNAARECRVIEYKAELPGGSDEEVREFLQDVTSFANASGGDLLYGISAKDGIPQKAEGVVANVDEVKLRLDSIIRTGVQPRIINIQIHNVDGFSKGPVFLIRIPRSWNAPHMVTFKNLSRFFTRDSAGKHQMDVTEIREQFSLAESLPEKIRGFRDERIDKIILNETPVPLVNGPKIVLHLLPLNTFRSSMVAFNHGFFPVFRPIGGWSGGWDHRINIDGEVSFVQATGGDKEIYSYTQIYRSGRVEAVDGLSISEKKLYREYERNIIAAVDRYLKGLHENKIEFPVIIFLSMVGVKDVTIPISSLRPIVSPIDRNMVKLPEILIEEYNHKLEISQIMKSTFDLVWNACGYQKSNNYDNDGKWIG